MDELALLKDFRLEDAAANRAREHARAALRAAMTRRRIPRRRYAVALAFVLAAVLAATAYAIVHEFVIAGPAPPEVKHTFAAGDRAAARMMPLFRQPAMYDTLFKEAHGVVGIDSSVGPVVIWAAPTKGGGVCWILDIQRLHLAHRLPSGITGCDPLPWRRRAVLEAGVGWTRVGDKGLRLLDGRAREDVASVEVQFADGRTEELPVIGGFFLDELRGAKPTPLIGRDRDGAEVGRLRIREWHPPAPQRLPLGPEDVLIRLQTDGGYELTFSIAHDAQGRFCEATRYRGAEAGGCNPGDPRDRVPRDDFDMWNEAGDGKPLVTLDGVVGTEIVRLELQFEDGTVVPVPITERFVEFEIPPEHHGDSRFVLTGYNRAGDAIARWVVK